MDLSVGSSMFGDEFSISDFLFPFFAAGFGSLPFLLFSSLNFCLSAAFSSLIFFAYSIRR